MNSFKEFLSDIDNIHLSVDEFNYICSETGQNIDKACDPVWVEYVYDGDVIRAETRHKVCLLADWAIERDSVIDEVVLAMEAIGFIPYVSENGIRRHLRGCSFFWPR